jgi:hypothetical protein
MINTAKLNACKVDRYVPVHSARVLGACVEPAGRDAAGRARTETQQGAPDRAAQERRDRARALVRHPGGGGGGRVKR